MDHTLQHFIDTSLYRRPDQRIKIVDLAGRFRSTLDARERSAWSRRRIVTQLRAAGYAIGTDGDRTEHVAGLSFQPPTRWALTDDGRLRQVPA